jgi:hypothetical protein
LRQSAAESIGRILSVPSSVSADLLPIACQLISDQASDTAIQALNSVKKFAKAQPETARKQLSAIVPPVMARLKDRVNLPLKLASERTLLHALQIFKNPEVLQSYSQTLDQTSARTLNDYVKRVISKLAEESEDEDNEDLKIKTEESE